MKNMQSTPRKSKVNQSFHLGLGDFFPSYLRGFFSGVLESISLESGRTGCFRWDVRFAARAFSEDGVKVDGV